MKNPLPKILATITRKPRMKVENLKWDKQYLVKNIFRLWELLFWKECQIDPITKLPTAIIRPQTSTNVSCIDGEIIRKETYHTWESSLCFVEHLIRKFVRDLATLNFSLNSPETQRAYAMLSVILFGLELKFTKNSFLIPMIAGAVSFTSSGQSSGSAAASSFSYSMNNFIGDYMLAASGSNGAPSSASYASVSMGTAITTDATVSNPFSCALWGLLKPAVGSNTFLVNKASAGSNDWYSNIVTYSGVDQTTPVDNFSHKYDASGTAHTIVVNVGVSNCWLVGWGFTDAGAIAAGASTTGRGSAPGTVSRFFDSNGTVGTGNQTLNINTGNGQFVGLGASLKPATTGVAYTNGNLNSTNWNSGTSKSTDTFAFTGNLLVVDICWSGGSAALSTVKWNTNESMTFGTSRTNSGGEKIETWYLMNPTNTTAAVTVTMASAPSNGAILASGYSGAGTPLQITNAAATGTSITCTLTVQANSWIHGSCGAQRTPLPGTGTLGRQDASGYFGFINGDSGRPLAAGSGNIIFTYSSITQGATYLEIPVASSAPVAQPAAILNFI